MKKLIPLLLLAAFCSVQTASSQIIRKEKSTTSKAMGLIKVHQVKPVYQKTDLKNIADQSRGVRTRGINLAAQAGELEKLCPFLKDLKPYLQLKGVRKDFELVGLKWETKDIISDRGFYVQRSLGDTNHFETVNFVRAQSPFGGKAKYRLPDKNDYDELSYYRLRLIVANGTAVYSNIAEVKGYSWESLTLFPNPVSSTLGLNIATKVEGLAFVSLYDVTGKLIRQQSASMMRGSNTQSMNVSNLLQGTYMIRVTMADKTIRAGKFIKQ